MSQFYGMDIENVRTTGRTLQQTSDDINGVINCLNNLVNSTQWQGPDADRFKNEWWPKHRDQLKAVSTEVHGLGQSALNNADEQQDVSQR